MTTNLEETAQSSSANLPQHPHQRTPTVTNGARVIQTILPTLSAVTARILQ